MTFHDLSDDSARDSAVHSVDTEVAVTRLGTWPILNQAKSNRIKYLFCI